MEKYMNRLQEPPVVKQIKTEVICLMEGKSIQDITVSDVVKHVGVSRTTFYRYFDSVDDVIKQIEKEIFDLIEDVSGAEMRDEYSRNSYALTHSDLERAEILYEYAPAIRVLLGVNGDPAFGYKSQKQMRTGFMGKYSELLRKEPHSDFFLEFLIAGMQKLIQYWLCVRPDVSPEEYFRIQREIYGMLKDYFEEANKSI